MTLSAEVLRLMTGHMRVVVIVSDVNARRALMDVLRALGAAEVVEASSSPQALDFMTFKTFHAIMIEDAQGGVAAAADFAEAHKKRYPRQRMHVVALAAQGGLTPEAIARCRKAGVADVILRPFTPARVAQSLSAAVMR